MLLKFLLLRLFWRQFSRVRCNVCNAYLNVRICLRVNWFRLGLARALPIACHFGQRLIPGKNHALFLGSSSNTSENTKFLILEFVYGFFHWLTYFLPVSPFYTPWKYQKMKGFLASGIGLKVSTKSNLRCFSRFLNCKNSTNLRNASHITIIHNWLWYSMQSRKTKSTVVECKYITTIS